MQQPEVYRLYEQLPVQSTSLKLVTDRVRRSIQQPSSRYTLQIVQDMTYNIKMRPTRSMHKLTNLCSYAKTCNSEINQLPNKSPTTINIMKWVSLFTIKLKTRVHRSVNSSSTKRPVWRKIKYIFSLGLRNTRRRASNLHFMKIVKNAKILSVKLLLRCRFKSAMPVESSP